MLHANDVAATGLIQTGSHARWRLLLAGAPAEVEGVSSAGQRPAGARRAHRKTMEEARPENPQSRWSGASARWARPRCWRWRCPPWRWR